MNPAKRLALPQNLAEAAESEGRHQWLTTVLPEIVDQARERWSLTVGEPFQPGGRPHDGRWPRIGEESERNRGG